MGGGGGEVWSEQRNPRLQPRLGHTLAQRAMSWLAPKPKLKGSDEDEDGDEEDDDWKPLWLLQLPICLLALVGCCILRARLGLVLPPQR